MSRQSIPPLLSLLPREILHSILAQYCDCKTMAIFWQAISACRPHAPDVWFLLDKVVEERLYKLDPTVEDSKERILSCISPLEEEVQTPRIQVLLQTRHLSQRLMALDYCEKIPDVIWCGHMEFKDPMLPDWSAQHAQVVLRSDDDDDSWSLRNIHGWSSSFPIQIKLVSQTYNFIPIRPRGRIYGVSDKDKETIRDIRRRLESRDQVMTLRYRNDDGFILRIISPEQAKLRLASFFHHGNQNQHDNFESFPEGLLCSWEYPSDDDLPLTKEDQFKSVAHTLWNYKKALALLD